MGCIGGDISETTGKPLVKDEEQVVFRNMAAVVQGARLGERPGGADSTRKLPKLMSICSTGLSGTQPGPTWAVLVFLHSHRLVAG